MTASDARTIEELLQSAVQQLIASSNETQLDTLIKLLWIDVFLCS